MFRFSGGECGGIGYLYFCIFRHISPIARTRGHDRCKEHSIIPVYIKQTQGKPKNKKVLDGFRVIAQNPVPQHTKKRHTSRCVTDTAIMREGSSNYKLKTDPSTKLPLLLYPCCMQQCASLWIRTAVLLSEVLPVPKQCGHDYSYTA